MSIEVAYAAILSLTVVCLLGGIADLLIIWIRGGSSEEDN